MFALFFQWRLKPGLESQFLEAWPIVTNALLEQGSHGSVLFQGPEGSVCAIARWPDRQTRDASSSRRSVPDAHRRMTEAIEEERVSYELSELINMWAPFPPPPG